MVDIAVFRLTSTTLTADIASNSETVSPTETYPHEDRPLICCLFNKVFAIHAWCELTPALLFCWVWCVCCCGFSWACFLVCLFLFFYLNMKFHIQYIHIRTVLVVKNNMISLKLIMQYFNISRLWICNCAFSFILYIIMLLRCTWVLPSQFLIKNKMSSYPCYATSLHISY